MAVLQPNEYDASYFEGSTQTFAHNAGYSSYQGVEYNQVSTRFVDTLEDSTGTVFGDMAKGLNVNNRFIGKKILIVGCAYGFLVQGLRNLGIDAWGIDVSSFAISQAVPEVAPYLQVADANIIMSTYKRNEFDWIISRWFLECIDDADLPSLIDNMNKASREQVHIVFPDTTPPEYYNVKTLEEWKQQPFSTGTILIPGNDFSNYVTVI